MNSQNEPREYTEAEVRTKFLELVWSYIHDWQEVSDKTCAERLEGLAFSILVILDGESAALPGFIVAPCLHQDARTDLESRGKNWYPENHETGIVCNISGCLHELFYGVVEGDGK